MTLEAVAFQLLNAFVWAWILALVALGLTVVFGYLDIVNVSHGALYSVGGITAWYVVHWAGTSNSPTIFLLAIVASCLMAAVVGLASFFLGIKPMEGKPTVLTLVTTFGLLFIIQHCVFLIFGGDPRTIKAPFLYNVPLFGRTYPVYRLAIVVFSMVLIGAMWLYLQRSRYGMWIRALQQNRELATAMGIPTRRLTLLIFAVGSGLAGLAGAVAAPLVQVQHDMGLSILVDAFIVVIAAGAGNLGGTIVVAIVYQVFGGLMALWFTPIQAKVLALAGVLVWVLCRPRALLDRA